MSKRKQQRITAIKINMYQLYLTASKNKENLTEKKIMEIKVQKEFINENRESQVIVIILIFFFYCKLSLKDEALNCSITSCSRIIPS